METNEFRIGNFVLQPNGLNQIFQITTDEINTYSVDDILAVRITKEWLERFGFTTIGFVDGCIGNKGISLTKRNNSYIVTMGYDCNHDEPSIKYVHELQNIYWALNGKELTIK